MIVGCILNAQLQVSLGGDSGLWKMNDLKMEDTSKNKANYKSSSVSSLSVKKVPETSRRISARQSSTSTDMETFVAYADYRGPQRHPPRNN